ncbi:MAG: hypothetical protein KGK08_02120 [Acidobacteriota bacterium]|nr:hypothetical protein [Acidobacteriota bacterium]
MSSLDPQLFSRGELQAAIPALRAAADSSTVARTHRVIHARARAMQQQRSRVRSLWIPLAVCSALLVILSTAIWSLLDQYELVPTGVPDSDFQLAVLVVWFFPVSAAVLAMVWFRRNQSRAEDETTR